MVGLSEVIPKGFVPGVPVVDLKTSPYIWAILDSACNSSVFSARWLRNKMAHRIAHFNLGCRWIHQNQRGYGGLACANTSKVVGEIAWAFVACCEDEMCSEGGVVPHYVGTETNVVGGGTNFVMGLDLQRFLKTKLDVVENVCYRRDQQGIWRPLQ